MTRSMLISNRSKHFMQLSTKIADESFKIYSLCDENYMLDFLFISKIHFIFYFSHTNLLRTSIFNYQNDLKMTLEIL